MQLVKSRLCTFKRLALGGWKLLSSPQHLCYKLQADQKKQSPRLGNPPNSLEVLTNIPNELGMTLSGQRFLIVLEYYIEDHGDESGSIIIFDTKDDVIELFKSELIVGDGLSNQNLEDSTK